MDKIKNLKIIAQSFLDGESCGHDFLHCLRVMKIAEDLAHTDFIKINREILAAAALMHDICRPWEKKTGISHFSEEALGIIDEQLDKAEYSAADRLKIIDIIRWHDIYNPEQIPPSSFTDELRVHQDADRIDALGAIGIARTFAFGGSNKLPLFIPGESLSFNEHFIDQPGDKRSSIAHFYEKLLKLRDQMNTPTGRKLAEVRHSRMERFLAEFFEEWGVDPTIE
jgi:uncharacterized protein